MQRISVDIETIRKLQDLSDSLELCDESGRVLGHFLPLLEPWPQPADPSEYVGVDSPTSREELLERVRRGGGRTWPEIRADWERLAN
ncbi:MAG: hypothetical protein KY476_03240 [Planctomycetes bacterium]|nr:hypothetical protein [Planctomycetota bacterium]